MPRTRGNRCVQPMATALLILLLALGLAACGGSSKGSSSATNASASPTKQAKRGGQFRARASALRDCLKKNGITLPERKARRSGRGAGGPGGPYGGQPPIGAPYGQSPSGAPSGRGAFGSGAGRPRLPKGVTRAQFDAAMKKCGGGVFGGEGRGFNTTQGRQRFAKFAQCMRKNGVKLPAPNTSGRGPIFNTKGIDTNSAAFKAANAKCLKELRPSSSGGPGREGGGTPGGPGTAPGGAAPEGPPPGA